MIRRDVALTGTARPRPTPATAVLMPTIRAAGIRQRPSGAARVEGSIGLDDVLDHAPVPSGPDGDGTAQSADHSGGDGTRESQRITNGDHQLPDPERFGVAQVRRCRRRRPAVDHGKVGKRVGSHHLHGGGRAVREDRVS